MSRSLFYGWNPDRPDHRDKKYTAVKLALPTQTLPSSVDLEPYCPPVVDQGQIGACTGCSSTAALEFLEIKDKMAQEESYSRLFAYYNGRMAEGTTQTDSGAAIRDVIKCLAKYGCCFESDWPYRAAAVETRPKSSAYAEASLHKVVDYFRIETLDDMKHCLASGYPFVFGFTVYESFESDEVAKTGIVNLPNPNEKCYGGHAVLAVGYDDATQRIKVRNSWGTDWGQKGYFTMPYAYIDNADLASDFWTVRKGQNM